MTTNARTGRRGRRLALASLAFAAAALAAARPLARRRPAIDRVEPGLRNPVLYLPLSSAATECYGSSGR